MLKILQSLFDVRPKIVDPVTKGLMTLALSASVVVSISMLTVCVDETLSDGNAVRMEMFKPEDAYDMWASHSSEMPAA